jgi:AcrR family transcriptional regulator
VATTFATVRCIGYGTVEREAGTVKGRTATGTRRYDSPRRAEQARQTRGEVLAAAEHLFRGQGFAATTVAVIAARAEVSVETVYKTFGGKPGLVRAICEGALKGDGPVPAETRSDELQEREADPRAVIRGWGRLSVEVAPRIAPLLLLLREAAATDIQMRELKAELDDQRLRRMTQNARSLVAHLRPGITMQAAAEVLWTYSSAEIYDLLVLQRGWSVVRFGEFISEAMIAALLPVAPDA